MKESRFKEYVKHWLQKEGYELKSIVFPLADVPTRDALRLYGEAYHQLFSKNKQFFVSPHFPGYLFVRRHQGYPDIIGVKNGEAFAFEVKTNLEYEQLDRCIGQCLRYLTDPWMDKIYIVIPKGIEGIELLKDIISNFKLPIHVIELVAKHLSEIE